MIYVNDTTQENNDLLYLNEPTPFDNHSLYKIYNDGGHYIATPYSYYPSRKKNARINDTLILLFDYLYDNGIEEGLQGEELTEYIKTGMLKEYPNFAEVDSFILSMIERKKRNLYARKKRFKRKANMNKWNYFVTVTHFYGHYCVRRLLLVDVEILFRSPFFEKFFDLFRSFFHSAPYPLIAPTEKHSGKQR